MTEACGSSRKAADRASFEGDETISLFPPPLKGPFQSLGNGIDSRV
jgi:hypothetical protein